MGRRIAFFLAAFLLVGGLLVLLPGIDLWASGLFYRPGDGFFLSDWPPFRAIYVGIPYLVYTVIGGVLALLAASMLRRKPFLGIDRRVAAFLLLSLAFGPGIVVNTVFKDHWGRARPTQVVAFDGDKRFTPAFVPSDQCRHNCSFPAGHPAVAFYLVSFAFLLPDRRRRHLAEAGAIAFGAVVGIARIAQGGHFLSDVVLSGFFVYATSWLLHEWIVRRNGLAALARHARSPPLPVRRLVLLAVVTATAVFLSIRFVDRPLAIYFHGIDPNVQRVFRFVTQFGDAAGYLVVSAVLFIGFRIASARATSAVVALRFAGHARRAGFVFLTVAVSGLVTDLLKPIFGRMRPQLFFGEHLYGFTWGGAHAAYWSFPSGHTVTIVSLAMALYLLWPRGSPAYVLAAVLVAASRIIITAHYLSDVLAGAFLAVAVTWALWAAARGRLADADNGYAPMHRGSVPSFSDSP